MSANLVHLMWVHVSVLGFPLAWILAVAGFINKLDGVQNTAYLLAFACCVANGISYFSGPRTYENLEVIWEKAGPTAPLGSTAEVFDGALGNPGLNLTKAKVENHAILGRVFFLESVVLFVLMLIQLLNVWQGHSLGRGFKSVFLIILFLLSLTGVFTAHAGGKIRRPELWNELSFVTDKVSGPFFSA